MFDFIKIQNLIIPDVETLRHKLDISISIDSDSVIVPELKTKKLNGMFYGFYDKYANLMGSIHYCFNKGKHNYNDFYVSDLLKVLSNFYSEFDINPKINKLNNLEFGVNIKVPFNIDKFLYNLITHNGKLFSVERGKNKTYYQFKHSNYILKFYNKGKQARSKGFNIKGEILRYEIKVIRMEYLHAKGINIEFLSDLLNTSLYGKLGKLLIDSYNEILIYDNSVIVDELKPKQREFYKSAENFKYWVEIFDSYTDEKGKNSRQYRNKRTYYQRKIKEFREIQKIYSKDNNIKLVGDLIVLKWNELTKVTTETQSAINSFLMSEKCSKITDNTKISLIQKCSKTTDMVYNHIATNNASDTPRRYCISCNKEITHQKDNSKFCSPKYVGVVGAHRCRNADSNLRNKIQRINSRGVLFDISPFFNYKN